MKQRRLKPADRRQEILVAALKLAIKLGYEKVGRERIAEAIGITGTGIQYHFKTIKKLKQSLMLYAIESECLHVIAQGLVRGDVYAKKAPLALRRKALNYILDN